MPVTTGPTDPASRTPLECDEEPAPDSLVEPTVPDDQNDDSGPDDDEAGYGYGV